MVFGGLVLGPATVLYLVGVVVYISARYGQGGSKLEAAVSHAPLANGLADNRKWKFGFYVNREDPSLFVEERFGWGYEPNLGNPWAVVFYVGGLVVILALAAMCFGSITPGSWRPCSTMAPLLASTAWWFAWRSIRRPRPT